MNSTFPTEIASRLNLSMEIISGMPSLEELSEGLDALIN